MSSVNILQLAVNTNITVTLTAHPRPQQASTVQITAISACLAGFWVTLPDRKWGDTTEVMLGTTITFTGTKPSTVLGVGP